MHFAQYPPQPIVVNVFALGNGWRRAFPGIRRSAVRRGGGRSSYTRPDHAPIAALPPP